MSSFNPNSHAPQRAHHRSSQSAYSLSLSLLPSPSQTLSKQTAAPVVVGTFFSHFLHSKNPKNKKRSRARKANSTSTTAAGANIEASANPKGRPNIIGPNGQVGDGGEGDSREDETESPETEFAYDEGLKIVKTFLKTAKSHTVEELQSFTAMHVPSPSKNGYCFWSPFYTV